MIILYDTTLLEIGLAQLGNDAAAIAYLNATKSAMENVFTTVDDATIAANPILYWVGESSPGSPTGVNAKNTLAISMYSATKMLNENPVITIRVNDLAGAPIAASGIPITLSANNGLFDAYTIVTDISGAATATFYPTKQLTAAISASSPLCIGSTNEINFLPPSTATDQNWIQTNDIGPSVITLDKLSGEVGVIPSIVGQTNIGTPTINTANSIIVDATHIYINAYAGPGATGATLYKVLKTTYAVVDSLAYSSDNLTSGYDGMADDGTDIWLAAAGDILQINKAAMTLTNTFTIDAAGTLEFVVDDATHVWSFVWGGGTYPNQVVKIKKADGSIVLNVDPKGGFGSNIHLKQAALIGNLICVNHDQASLWASYIDRTTGAVTIPPISLSGGTAHGIASDGEAIWQSTSVLVQLDLDPTGVSAEGGTITATEIGKIFDLFYDGVNMWCITSEVGGSTPKYLRQLVKTVDWNGASYAIAPRLSRTIDLSVSGQTGPNIPNAIYAKDPMIYAALKQDIADSLSILSSVRYK